MTLHDEVTRPVRAPRLGEALDADQSVQGRHIARVLNVLSTNGALSRSQIAQRVGISRSTLSEVAGILLRRGAIVVADTDAALRAGRGRPAERLALDPAAGQFMGVDFGHGRVHVAVADAAHGIMASGGLRYPASAGWPERIACAFELVDRFGADTGIHYGALRGVGIGFPAPLTPYAGGENAAVADGFRVAADAVRDAFAERFHAAAIIDTNTRFAALAEASWARAAHTADLLYARFSDGIGGGLIVAGRLISGATGFAAELGHVALFPDGDPCDCGKRGCLETIASVPAVLRRCRAAGLDVAHLDDLRDAVRRSDPIAADVLHEAASAIGRVVGAAAVILNPAEIVLAGDVIDLAPAVLGRARAAIDYELLSMLASRPEIRGTRLGDDAGALGALVALFHHSPLLAGYPEPAGS